MKIRNGFVSNSSSSSFIVAVDGDKTKVTLTVEVDLADYGTVCRTETEVTEMFELDYGTEEMEDEDAMAPTYQKCLQAVRDGKIIILGSFVSDEPGVEAYLCEEGLPESPGMDIIENDAGY